MALSTVTYLGAYIVDLTLVLYEISTVATVDPPKIISTDLVWTLRLRISVVLLTFTP